MQVIKHELSMDGSLDFTFPMSTNQQSQLQHHQQQQQSNTMETGLQLGNASVVAPAVVAAAQQMPYSTTTRTSVTTPSWVH